MKKTRNKSLTLNLLLLVFLALAGCAPNQYTTPKTPLENFIWTESNAILKNVAKSCNETNRKRLEGIKLYLNRKSFAITVDFSKEKIFLPAQGNLKWHAKSIQKSYLKDRCPEDEACQLNLIKYYSIYHSLHELYHIVNKKKYQNDKPHPESVVKKPKSSQTRMSFAEETRAASVVAKYLSTFEPALLAKYKDFLLKFLEAEQFNMDAGHVEQQWNTFAYKGFKQMNNAQLFIFLHACTQLDGRSLEELLFEN